jgi:hypothetical protein
VEFLSGWKHWRERTGALAKFRVFLGNFGGFLECLERLGPSHNYFQKLRVLLQFLPMCRDRGEIYKKNRGFGAKFTRYNESGIVFQWKNPWTESMGPWTGWRSRVRGGPGGQRRPWAWWLTVRLALGLWGLTSGGRR